jgi:hypothetical protein
VFNLYVDDLKDEILIKLWNTGKFYSVLIGMAYTKLSAFCINGGCHLSLNFYNGEKQTAKVHFISQFTPESLIDSGFDIAGL